MPEEFFSSSYEFNMFRGRHSAFFQRFFRIICLLLIVRLTRLCRNSDCPPKKCRLGLLVIVVSKCQMIVSQGFYDSMDAGIMDDEGQIYVMSRDDDVINVAGHRLSTSALEEALLEHPNIAEAAVIGVPDAMKGELPLGLYVPTKS